MREDTRKEISNNINKYKGYKNLSNDLNDIYVNEVFKNNTGLSIEKDDVSSMPYYDDDLKPIDAMLQQFGKQAVMSFCLCNAFKYLWRCNKKHETPIEDINKAMWYLNKYLELYGKNKD